MKSITSFLYLQKFLLGMLVICSVPVSSAQVCSAICNRSFEDVQLLTPNTMGLFTQNNVPCWKTTAPDSIIEIWGSGFNLIPSYSGNQFAELSGNTLSTLYQDFTATPGTSTISFAHRGRYGTDVVSVSVGPVGGPYTVIGTFSAGNTAWTYHTVSYTFPSGPNTSYSLRFNTVSTTGSNPAEGNFLDAVSVTLASPVISITATNPSCSAGGSLTAAVSGGTPGYTYDWQPVSGSSPVLSNLPSGTYTLTVTDANGCTSNATASIYGGPSSTTIPGAICGNEPYYFNGNPYTQSGTYSFHYTTAGGCDSTIILELETHPIYRDSFVVAICSDQTYTYNGQVYPPTTGVYDFTFQSIYGCDSLVRMYINPNLLIYTDGGDTVCAGDSVQLHVFGGNAYHWSPENLLDNPDIANPVAVVTETTEFTVHVSTYGPNLCADAIEHITITVPGHETVYASGDTVICEGSSVQLSGTGAETYSWSPTASVNDPQSSQPFVTPAETTTYYLEATTSIGCVIRDSVLVELVHGPPVPFIPDSITICAGLASTLSVSGADSYAWSPAAGITPLSGPTVSVSPVNSTTYFCDFTNICGTVRDSILVQVLSADIQAGPDTIVCPKEPVILSASGGISYTWSPAGTPLSENQVMVSPVQSTEYEVVGTNSNGCTDTALVNVQVYPKPVVQVTDQYAIPGDDVQLTANSGNSPGTFVWYPAEYLSCMLCQDPIAHPDKEMSYDVTFTDTNGCSTTDRMTIFYKPQIYVPNTFIPDGNQLNDEFKAVCSNIDAFEMMIYDRWGEEVFRSDSATQGWDGTYGSKACPEGIYSWTIRYEGSDKSIQVLLGHVTLIR